MVGTLIWDPTVKVHSPNGRSTGVGGDGQNGRPEWGCLPHLDSIRTFVTRVE